MKLSNVITTAASILLIAFFSWIGFSFLNTVAHNLSTDPAYATWNLFAMIF